LTVFSAGALEVSCKGVNCKSVFHELCDFLDGELDTGTVEEIKLHLDRCEDCRLLVDTTKKTIEIFCNAEPLPLPQDLRDRLHTALEQRLRGPRT
jgi:predicted anti-sigma-YlaC factor YlaD